MFVTVIAPEVLEAVRERAPEIDAVHGSPAVDVVTIKSAVDVFLPFCSLKVNVQVEVSGLVDVVTKPMVSVCWSLTAGVPRASVVVVPLPLTQVPAFTLDVQVPVVPVQVAIAAVEPFSPTLTVTL